MVSEKNRFSGKSSVPGSEAARDTWLLQKKQFSANSSVQGSEAAREKLLLIKKIDFLEKVLPQAAKLPGTSGFFKTQINFLPEVLPQAAKLPGTSGFL